METGNVPFQMREMALSRLHRHAGQININQGDAGEGGGGVRMWNNRVVFTGVVLVQLQSSLTACTKQSSVQTSSSEVSQKTG